MLGSSGKFLENIFLSYRIAVPCRQTSPGNESLFGQVQPPFFCLHHLQRCIKLKISYLVPFQDTEDEDWVYELKAQFQEVEMVDLVID